ncbi:hypothetical protein lerEdw1_010010 [Lerista edwardsae]|nr:hypothetical protein lerEdw1_010010 [Lerista edwardsae]
MNRFGKQKEPSQIPPVPPKRPEKWEEEAHSGAEEEDEQEDHYTYEVPRSEGQTKKVAPAKWQDNAESVYLDRPTLRRSSEPSNTLQPPKPLKFLSKLGADDGHGEEGFKFTALEEDPFPPAKDEKESEEESIYIECEPTTVSTPCRAPPGPNLALPARPMKQSKPKSAPPGPQEGLAENPLEDGGLKSGSLLEDASMQNKAWYAGRCDRHTAEAALFRFNKDSAYMVRQSSGHGWNQPFTLAVLYKNHVYNIPIRYLESSRQYTLGKDRKNHEELFDSVSSIIQYYTERSLVLIDGSTSAKEQTCLLFPVKP